MNKEIQAKFLQYLSQAEAKKKLNCSEVLVAIIVAVMGMAIALPAFSRLAVQNQADPGKQSDTLSGISLPSLLPQVVKAKQSEAKQYVGTMNRGQQAYFLENADFATDLTQLDIGIKTQTDNYVYGINILGEVKELSRVATNNGFSIQASLKSYAGVVSLVQTNSEVIPIAILCESDQPGVVPEDKYKDVMGSKNKETGELKCPNGYSQIK